MEKQETLTKNTAFGWYHFAYFALRGGKNMRVWSVLPWPKRYCSDAFIRLSNVSITFSLWSPGWAMWRNVSRWFSPGTLVSSTNYHWRVNEILQKDDGKHNSKRESYAFPVKYMASPTVTPIMTNSRKRRTMNLYSFFRRSWEIVFWMSASYPMAWSSKLCPFCSTWRKWNGWVKEYYHACKPFMV